MTPKTQVTLREKKTELHQNKNWYIKGPYQE